MRVYRDDVWPQVVAVIAILLGAFTAGESWGMNHGLMLVVMGCVVLCSKSVRTLPRWAWGLAGVAVLLSLSPFTPIGWGTMPQWRTELEALGVDTGSLKAVQARHAMEQWAVMVLSGGVALWLGGRRSAEPMIPALTLVIGVAIYAIVSYAQMETANFFGFFPNRNHSATLLAMACLVGLGCCAECVKERRQIMALVAVLATATVLWALMSWSVSKAGFVLLVVGALIWVPLVGRRYFNRRVANVLVTLVFLVIVALTARESRLLERLTTKSEQVTVAMVESADNGTSERTSSIQDIDFRIPTWLDSIDCLKTEWVRGFGTGQFRYVFPQYRERTSIIGYRRSMHPESDWLWVAMEHGVPTVIVLLLLVTCLGGYVWKRSLRTRSFKAVRLGCLVGALLLVVHSCFDVPAHRVPLLWQAALLIGLALPDRGGRGDVKYCNAGAKILGLCVFAAGGWLLSASTGVMPGLVNELASSARGEAERLYRQDRAVVDAAIADGRSIHDLDDGKLNEAIYVLEAVEQAVPLDPEVWRMRADLALQFDDRQDAAKRGQSVERVLLPNAVEVPLIQAEGWGTFDPHVTVSLWQEALRRSVALESINHNVSWGRERTVRRIRTFASRSPVLEEAAAPLLSPMVEGH